MSYKRSDFTKQLAEKLVAEHGNVHAAAKAVAKNCLNKFGKPAAPGAVKDWIFAAIGRSTRKRVEQLPFFKPAEVKAATKFLELIKKSNLDPQVIADGDIHIEGGNFKTWGVLANVRHKDGSSEPVTKSLYSIGVKLSPSWDRGPQWPVIVPAKPVKVSYQPRPATSTGVRTVAIVSDLQIGFRRDIRTGQLTPMHDLAAIQCALDIVSDIKPSGLGYIGDVGDFASLSTYLQHKEFQLTLQPALDEVHRVFSQFESAMGSPTKRERTFVVGGNHDARIGLYATRNAMEAFGIRQAQKPDSWPVLSFPALTRMDDLGMEWVGEYPGAEKWLTPELVVRHEPPTKGERFDASVIHGHRHRLEKFTDILQTRHGSKAYSRWDVGCLASLDRITDPNSLERLVVPSGDRGRCGWAQGFAVATILNDGHYDVDLIRIVDGRALYRGKMYGKKKAAA